MTHRLALVSLVALALSAPPVSAQEAHNASAGWRTIEFEATEVTAPDVAVSPDGQWLVFTMLGHLFRLPVEGGEAEQLTFGPYHDLDPAISPDGSRVAFGSNRDGSDGNVYLLSLADGQINQLTHDSLAGRPAWAPDGETIAYLRLRTRSYHCPTGRAGVARVALDGGEPEHVVGADSVISAVLYLPDGRLAWAVVKAVGWPSTRIDAFVAPDSAEPLATLRGAMGRVLADPAGNGFYGRGNPGGASGLSVPEHLVYQRWADSEAQRVATLTMPPCQWAVSPSFAIAPTGDAVYLGEAGRLWKHTVRDGVRAQIPFHANVTLEVRETTAPRATAFPAPGEPLKPRAIMSPTLAPGGDYLVVGAADHLWRQPTDGGPAQRLVGGSGHEREPALSPDGQHLLFISSGAWEQRVRMLDLESQEIQTLATGLLYWHPAWSRDGRRVVFVGVERSAPGPQLIVVDLEKSITRRFAVQGSRWLSRPQFSADGEWLYYSAQPNATRSLYRLRLDAERESEPEEFIALDRHLHDPALSPDEQWVAFRRNTEIWLARVSGGPAPGDRQIHRVSDEGGDGFAFTPDGTALVYASGNKVWRQAIADGERVEIPMRLPTRSPAPPPVLIRDVRVLDFTTGGFGAEASLMLEGGRIRSIGTEPELPRDAVILDGGGRFAIPGLFDMHAHATAGAWSRSDFQEAWLAYGVTSVREAENGLAFSATLVDRSEASSDPVPRYFFSGNVFCGELGPLPWETAPPAASFVMSNESDVRTYVRWWSERGVHFIKTHPCLSWSLHRALADEARRVGLPVMEHGNAHDWLLRSVTLGSRFVEHFDSYADDVLQLLAATGTGWSPTLTLDLADVALLEPRRRTDAKLRAFAIEGLLEHQQSHLGSVDTARWREARSAQLAVIDAAYRRGVRLYAGTDAPYGPVPGASLHRELRSFVHAGIPPLEVLRIATQVAAAAVGAGDDLGTIEVGKLADIVLLDQDPLEDIEHSKAIWRVIKGGWVFDPEDLKPGRN